MDESECLGKGGHHNNNLLSFFFFKLAVVNKKQKESWFVAFEKEAGVVDGVGKA